MAMKWVAALAAVALASPAAAEYLRREDDDYRWQRYEMQRRIERIKALDAPQDRMKIDGTWVLEHGITFVATITITNDNDFPVKDPQIVCHLFANSGTVVRKLEHTLYERLEAFQTRRFTGVRMGLTHEQARRSDCWIGGAWSLPNG